jgi:hypothetical protein
MIISGTGMVRDIVVDIGVILGKSRVTLFAAV